MQELLEKLAAHRRRIKIARTVETAVRWAFYASVVACLYLTASKIAGLTVPRAVAATVLVAIPLGMAAREWARSFSVRDCAVYLDRALRLEERLSTAVEVPGALSGAQLADAAGALAQAPAPSRRMPREAKFLAGSALLLAALAVIPSPERSGASWDPALAAVAESEAVKLEALSAADPELRQAAELLRKGKMEEALALLQALQQKLGAALLDAEGSGGPTKDLLDAVAASAAAVAAELARAGRTVHAPEPVVAAEKLDRQRQGRVPSEPRDAFPAEVVEGKSREEVARSIAATLNRRDWNPRYDSVIRKYFGSPR